MSEISEKIADFLVREKIIDSADYPIYKYGAEILIENVVMSLFLLCFGFIIHKGIVTIVFVLTFVGVRRFSGGYHASTKAKCHILTLGNWALVLILFQVQQEYGLVKWWMAVILCLLVFVVMLLFAPVENEKKKLLEEVRIKNRKKTLILCGALISLVLIFWIKLPQVSFAMLVTLIEAALLILI